jgi:hypothetical protein
MKFRVLNSSHATNPGIAFVWQWTPVDSHFCRANSSIDLRKKTMCTCAYSETTLIKHLQREKQECNLSFGA